MKLIRFLKSVGLDTWAAFKEFAVGLGAFLLAMIIVFGSLSFVGWVLSFWVPIPANSSPVFMTLVAFGMAGVVTLFIIGGIFYWAYRLAHWLVNSWRNA